MYNDFIGFIFQLSFYKAIPLRAMSRLWGYISGCYIPRQLRYWLYTAYSKLFGVIIDEIELPMESYKSLGEFFARRLKDGARPICLDRPMVMICIVKTHLDTFLKLCCCCGNSFSVAYYH